jgi:hypothetical protein
MGLVHLLSSLSARLVCQGAVNRVVQPGMTSESLILRVPARIEKLAVIILGLSPNISQNHHNRRKTPLTTDYCSCHTNPSLIASGFELPSPSEPCSKVSINTLLNPQQYPSFRLIVHCRHQHPTSTSQRHHSRLSTLTSHHYQTLPGAFIVSFLC